MRPSSFDQIVGVRAAQLRFCADARASVYVCRYTDGAGDRKVVFSFSGGILSCNARLQGPTPGHPEKMEEFGQFVGRWDVDVTWHEKDRSVAKRLPGEREFAYVWEGRAVVDIWQVPPRDRREPGAKLPPGECGMTVRFYDVSFNPPVPAWMSNFEGRGEHAVGTSPSGECSAPWCPRLC